MHWMLMSVAILLLLQSNVSDAQCTHGDVGLIWFPSQSSNLYHGVAQVCSFGQWSIVCARDNWGTNEARVICRQLGYSDKEVRALQPNFEEYPMKQGPLLFPRSLYCNGTETSWLECDFQSSSCGFPTAYFYSQAQVECTTAPPLQVSIRATPQIMHGVVYAGSSLTLECIVSPYTTGIETYRWSSGCTGDCFVQGNTKTIRVLKSEDSGNHTCTVSRVSASQSTSVSFRVIEPEIVSALSTSTIIAITEGISIILIVFVAISSCVVCALRQRKFRKSGGYTRMMDYSDVSYERVAGVNISGGRQSRPITATLNRTVDDVYEQSPLKPDEDEEK